MGFLQGKRALIVGVASKRSIAWGIAEAMHRQGAELAFTYQTEKLRSRVEQVAEVCDSEIIIPCEVAFDDQIDNTFTELAKHWDGFDIEETACVVEFDLAQLCQAAALAFCPSKREVDLPSDGPGRHGFVEGVLPEIAHQAAPRAFLIGEKDRQPINETAVVIAFLLDQPGVGAAWVKRALLAALPGDPVAAGGRGFRISKAGICGGVRNKARGIFYGVAPRGRGCFRGENQPMSRRAGSAVFQKPAYRNQAPI